MADVRFHQLEDAVDEFASHVVSLFNTQDDLFQTLRYVSVGPLYVVEKTRQADPGCTREANGVGRVLVGIEVRLECGTVAIARQAWDVCNARSVSTELRF